MPWYPFFQKMEEVDLFVILGHCQFEKNNYQNRFQMDDQWNTMSVNKGTENIVEKRYVEYERDWAKIKKRLTGYNLGQFDEDISGSLFDTNVAIIRRIRDMLHINTEIAFDSPTTAMGTERLIEIIRRHGASSYVAGRGSVKYMDTEKLIAAGIRLSIQSVDESSQKPILRILRERNV